LNERVSFLGRFVLSKPVRIFLSVALIAVAVGSVAPGPRALAGEEMDPLIADGLAALDALVAEENCTPGDAADGETTEDAELPFTLCNDGVPPQGGGADGIPVPVAYKTREVGGDYRALPAPASLEEAAEKDALHDLRPEEDGRRITLDVDITLPPADLATPSGGHPVLVFMHGCCGGSKTSWEATSVDAANEKYHHSNAWFATRGYVVVTYTARGFRNNQDRGSTGTTQLDSRRYEINDYQYLVGLLVDHDRQRDAASAERVFDVNPRKVTAVGGSYGGGFTWLALTDPTWRSPAERVPMRLAAAVPRYGWTDLVEALVPSGHYRDRKGRFGTEVAPSDPNKAPSGNPLGVMKQSIVGGLYASGNLVASDHTTFPDYVHETIARLQVGEPYEGDPTIEESLEMFLRDRSAYFQQRFWKRVRNGLRVPTFAAATWTDPLFPTMESLRFYNKLKKIDKRYPIDMYLGDYQHFAQNKPKEWGDLCGKDHHVCTVEDFRNSNDRIRFNRAPSRIRKGIQTRTNRFLNDFVLDKGSKPKLGVAATTTICSENATKKLPVDEPGIEYRARTWRRLQPWLVNFDFEEDGTTSTLAPDDHAAESDPVFRDQQSDICYTTDDGDPGDGVVQYRSRPLNQRLTMLGIPSIKIDYETDAQEYWIAVRMYDAKPNGSMTMVTRGLCKVNKNTHEKKLCKRFDLFGNAWRFRPKHEVVIEVTQSDTPFLRKSNEPSELTIKGAALDVPATSKDFRADFRDK
jgi:predicted acyl esterase